MSETSKQTKTLHEAVRTADADGVARALEGGADVYALDADGRPPADYMTDWTTLPRTGDHIDACQRIVALLDHYQSLADPPWMPAPVHGPVRSGDLGLQRKVGWRRHDDHVELWLADTPESRLKATSADQAYDELFELVSETDCEPEFVFVRGEPTWP